MERDIVPRLPRETRTGSIGLAVLGRVSKNGLKSRIVYQSITVVGRHHPQIGDSRDDSPHDPI